MPFTDQQRDWVQGVVRAGPVSGGRKRRDDDEDEPAYVPMALPDPKKAPKSHVVEMEPMALDPKAKDPADRQALRDAKTQAKADHDREGKEQVALVEGVISRLDGVKANYGVMVHGACLLFQIYARKKIDEIKGNPDPADILGGVFGAAMGVLAAEFGGIAAKVASDLVKNAVDAVVGLMKDQAVKIVENALKKDFASLEKAVDEIVVQSVVVSDRLGNTAIGGIRDPLNAIVAALKKDQPLKDEQQAVVKVLQENSGDKALELLGMPMQGTAKNMQSKVYRTMVKAFEVQRITYNRKEADLPPEPRGVDHAANRNADEAVKELDGVK